MCPTKHFPEHSHPDIYHAFFLLLKSPAHISSAHMIQHCWVGVKGSSHVSALSKTQPAPEMLPRALRTCTKYVHQVCAPSMRTKCVHQVCALRMCTKYINMCTMHQSAHLLVDLMSTRYAAFPPEVQATCTKPGGPILAPVHQLTKFKVQSLSLFVPPQCIATELKILLAFPLMWSQISPPTSELELSH